MSAGEFLKRIGVYVKVVGKRALWLVHRAHRRFISPRRRALSPTFIIAFVCSSRVAMAIAISSERRRHFLPQPKGVWVPVPWFLWLNCMN